MADVYAKPNAPIRLFLEDAPPGLSGTLTVRIRDAGTDADVVGPVGGSDETQTGETSTYAFQVTTPATVGDDYLILFESGGETIGEDTLEITDTPPGVADLNSPLAPAVAEVAGYVYGRTRGGPVGQTLQYTFTDDTSPTQTAVKDLIAKAVRKVRGHVGVPTDPDLLQDARDVAALYAAMLVELRFRGENQRDRSTYDELKALYDGQIQDLVRQAQDVATGGAADESDDRPLPGDTFVTPVTVDADGTLRPYSWFADTF